MRAYCGLKGCCVGQGSIINFVRPNHTLVNNVGPDHAAGIYVGASFVEEIIVDEK